MKIYDNFNIKTKLYLKTIWFLMLNLEWINNETGVGFVPVIDNPNYTNTIGTPLEDFALAPGMQEGIDTCTIRSQQHILSMYDINVTESDLVKDAILHGEYAPAMKNGTSFKDTGNLLERHGIEVSRRFNATIDDLISELSQGHKIIVSVDAYEIWAENEKQLNMEHIKDLFKRTVNHDIVVVGVDNVTHDVDVVDPGNGKLYRVPADVFIDAWQDGNFYMLSTKQSPEEYFNHMSQSNEEVTPMSDPKRVEEFTQFYEEKIEPTPEWHEDQIDGHDVYVMSTNSNGNPDMLGVDVDGDGKIDIIGVDVDDDGKADLVTMDVDGDNVPDVYIFDFDNNGEPDSMGMDYDGDGKIDELVALQ